MKALKIKTAKATVNPGKGAKYEQTEEAHLKELKTEATNRMDESPQIDAHRLENITNNADKKSWNTIVYELSKKARILLDKIWCVASIVGRYTEIILTSLNPYNVSFAV